jgi:tetratricopeptide (TPR) repeat protein
MIPVLLALAAAATPPSAASCAALVKSAPEQAVELATRWRASGGGVQASQCQGLAFARLERWAPAATAFEQAALEAETGKDASRADYWVQAGNAWLAAGDAAKARTAFNAALAVPTLTAELRGEAHLDRARAAVAAGDLLAARSDVDAGLKLAAADPFAWYLSSALAVREQKLSRAKEDIAKALALAPDEPDLILHAGTVAGIGGDTVTARAHYERAAKLAPTSPAGMAAAAALAANAAPPTPSAK